ncbi:MAG TPA: glycoside hydrolase domain-containing protein [Trebonia sp.]|jgi:hypothetical protein|nr:glycoside hydrolase domain-containing protein [Trebonia sp.]
MRRAIAAAVVGGLVLGGVTAIPAFAATAARTTGKTSIKATGKKTAMKTVVYHGYEFQVPASWPVYRLDQHPTTCVRYDVHAVYLGTPGASMRCPAGLAGRTQTVSVIPSTTVASGSGSTTVEQRQQPDSIGNAEVGTVPAVRGAITQNSAEHELRVALGAASLGATVVATYGTDPAVVQRVLGTLRTAPARARQTPQSASTALSQPSGERAAVVEQSAAVRPRAKSPKKTTVYKSWHGVPRNWPVQIVVPQPVRTVAHPVSGFDSCTAPTIATMRVWRRQYAAVGVYIGGANSACAYGNLSAAWFKSAAALGWGMLPTYVGPQAPCWGYRGTVIDPSEAAAEGRAAGAAAVSDARFFGLGQGSPIYYDMEAYRGGASCTSAVLTFLGAWDRTVAAKGYLTGVYSSQDSGIDDMQQAAVARTAGFTRPVAIWIARWNGVRSLLDGDLDWPLPDRAKQYAGNLNQAVGGITLNIDQDLVAAPLAR